MREHFLPFGRPNFGEMEEAAILRVLRSSWIGMGAETIAFEEELATYLGVSHVVTVNSCTSALFLSLLVHGVQRGEEVIVPSLTWCSTANAVLYLDAIPVMCDVDPNTLSATWETIAPLITSRTKAVIVVHFGGLAAETQRIRENLPRHIPLIEDAAHAFGTVQSDGSLVGSHGNLTCFSFYANKNLSTGEGGAIALRDYEKAERLKSLRLHALHTDAWKRFQNKEVFEIALSQLGYKMNYTDMQACIGRVQLLRQQEFHTRRMAIVDRYCQRLPEIMPRIKWQTGVQSGGHSGHLFVVQLPIEQLAISRDEFVLLMRERNIGVAIHYAPLHKMPLYNQRYKQPTLPNVESLADRIVTLPISASMSPSDADDVLTAFEEVIASARRTTPVVRAEIPSTEQPGPVWK